jgi:ABC-type multidrug transport system fused ATPase/permease subunit
VYLPRYLPIFYYVFFFLLAGVALLLLGWVTLKGGIRASMHLHTTMLAKILKVPLAFFSENPSGRILNRFAQDIDKLDSTLPITVRDGIMACVSVLSVFILFISTNLNIVFGILILLAFIACLFLLWLHLSTSKLLKRLTLITQSPILSHVKESLNGKSTIRAFNSVERFIDELEAKIDHHQKFSYLFAASQCWQTVWLELIGATIITIVTLFVTLADREGMSSAKVGLVLTYALSFIQQLQALFQRTADIETNTVAVERIKEYTELEAEQGSVGGEERPEDWPSEGRIVFKNFSMSYRSDYLNVLKDINLTIESGQKVGIIGRTGAGKSSLISALIRIIKDTQGSIVIDDHDISRISLFHLRQRITIVPQDAVLFTGTLRFNLDPNDKHNDEQLIDILEKCRLTPLFERNGSTLSFVIDGKKNNLSVGEKQMVCLARALLRKSKIMIFDEATSSVDDNNERQLQQVVENDLKHCTVLTIAHRLDNVKDSDRIVVIDNGEVVECDTPENLLRNENSYFYKNLQRQ